VGQGRGQISECPKDPTEATLGCFSRNTLWFLDTLAALV
jgi:hypothetical protein